MTVSSFVRRNIGLAALFSLILAILPFGPHVESARATAGTGAITIVSTGGSSVGTDWTFSSGTITTVDADPATINSSDVVGYLNAGNLTVEAASIVVNANVVATLPASPNGYSLTLKSAGDISVGANVAITTVGGALILWADSDVQGNLNTASGHIALAAGSSLRSAGGDIVLGGGLASNGRPSGYAYGAVAPPAKLGSQDTAAISLHQATLAAGSGDVLIKGHGTGAGVNFQFGVFLHKSDISGATVTVDGRGSRKASHASSSNWGTLIRGTDIEADVQLDISGVGGASGASNADSNQQGIVVQSFSGDASELTATGSGSISLTGVGGGGNVGTDNDDPFGVIVEAFQIIRTDSGNISVTGTPGFLRVNSFSRFAVKLLSTPQSSSGEIVITGNPSTLGVDGVDRGGGLDLHGASSAGGSVSLSSPASVTQSAPIAAARLSLGGGGNYTLENTSNAIGTVAAGTSLLKVGTLSLYDASGGLTIGQVGSLEGVTATGDVLIETGAGDITLARSIATDSSTSTAITVNAGKSAAAGTGTGGDIVVSGSPELRAGTGARIQMFSGSEAASTGLTTLVGGSSNVRYGVDETTDFTANPLVGGRTYALYRSSVESPPMSGGSSGGSSSSSPAVTPVVPAPSVAPRPARVIPVAPNTSPVPRPVERLGFVFDPDAPSRATVGGATANLLKSSPQSSELSLTAGAFQFGVRLNTASGAEVRTETPSRSPELFVPRGQSAAVSGGGSYPGSFVQLFLAGNGNDSRELARIPVRSDGTFASDLSFGAGALELPVPIGRQVLQVVGYDELGNQTVVDMTVNIGQGVPAPEPNRQIGELPALTAGQSLATSGGIPETVSVTGVPETGNVVVEGSGWVISVNADRDNGVVENADGNVLVRFNPSSVGTTFGNGFLPGTLATVWLFSEPTLMTTVTVDDDGEFSAEFLVDSRLIAPGEHTLQVQGVGSDGYIKAANLGVLVEQPVEVTAESASGLLWWVLGFFVLALVFLFVLLARRRRRQDA